MHTPFLMATLHVNSAALLVFLPRNVLKEKLCDNCRSFLTNWMSFLSANQQRDITEDRTGALGKLPTGLSHHQTHDGRGVASSPTIVINVVITQHKSHADTIQLQWYGRK